MSFFIEETESQCLQHSQTGIVRGAPSKSDDETEASPFQGIAYQFARSEGGGFIGFLLSAGTSGRPLMAAISTNAVLPSPEMP